MMTTDFSKPVTIFEGPDGAGKSTAARWFSEQTGARYVHLGAFPGVSDGLPRLYVEAMLPALQGYQPVVMDRSWLSEPIYGAAFRDGRTRVDSVNQRMLERLAMRSCAQVVRCLPAWEIVRENYERNKSNEMLTNVAQLKLVYDDYAKLHAATDLPVIDYDYTTSPRPDEVIEAQRLLHIFHPADLVSVGNLSAPVLLVGEELAAIKNQDTLYQWPFASFSGLGCSRWLTEKLDRAGISEKHLLWVNADQDLLRLYPANKRVVTLGVVTRETLLKLRLAAPPVIHSAPHPQVWRRFHASEPYPLPDLLHRLLKEVDHA